MVSSAPDASPAAASEQYSGPKLGLTFFRATEKLTPSRTIWRILKETALRLPSSWRFSIDFERRLELETGAEHVGKLLGEEHDFRALQLDRALGNLVLLGSALAIGRGASSAFALAVAFSALAGAAGGAFPSG